MNINRIKKQRLKILTETITHYKHNQRCIIFTSYEDDPNRKHKEGQCSFDGDFIKIESEGDAVGRLLSKAQRKELDITYGESGVHLVFHELPKHIQNLGLDFLLQISILHDNSNYWNGTELSEEGEDFYEEIKEKFC